MLSRYQITRCLKGVLAIPRSPSSSSSPSFSLSLLSKTQIIPKTPLNPFSFFPQKQITTAKTTNALLQTRGYCTTTSTTDKGHHEKKTEGLSVNPSHHQHDHDCKDHHHEHHQHYHINDIKREERMYIEFNCGVCDFRVKKTFSKHSYEKGVVIIRCDGCRKLHLIADNLGFTGFAGERNIEEILQAKGEPFARIRVEPKIEIQTTTLETPLPPNKQD